MIKDPASMIMEYWLDITVKSMLFWYYSPYFLIDKITSCKT
jgi:hypothetical protein